MEPDPSSPKKILGKEGETLQPGECVMVRGRDFRCLAYRDKNGKWRAAFSHKELSEVLEILGKD